MTIQAAAARPDYSKWAFFGFMVVSTLIVMAVDERFLVDPHDHEWVHIEPFKFWLLIHGLAAATAYFTGPFQFLDSIRRTNLKLHRWLGRLYVGAIVIAAPVAVYIGTHLSFIGPNFQMEQYAQGGAWLFTTLMALVCVLRKQIEWHKRWMMKSYGCCLIFSLSRLPDAIPGFHWTEVSLTATLWWLIVLALLGPDVILTVRTLWAKRH